jgi:hypothetical protein
MTLSTGRRVAAAVVLLLVGYFAGRASSSEAVAAPQADTRVFEWRTYTTPDEEKFTMLQARFRDHTTKLFEKHGMANIGYWTPVDTPNTLTYIVAHKSMEDAKKSWAAFRADPDWQAVAKATAAAGLTGVKLESKYLTPTDYSPMK